MTEKEYIEREAAIKKLDHFQSHLHTVEGTHAIGVAKTLIKEIPAADVRPVGLLEQVEWERDTALAQLAEIGKSLGEKMDDVRPVIFCRDCTFFKPQQKSKRWSSTTSMCSRSATIKMPPDGFCSFGVKREES